MPAFEIGDVGKYGHICSVYHWKTFQYPNAQSWNVVIFSGTCLDQQMVEHEPFRMPLVPGHALSCCGQCSNGSIC